MPRPDELKRVAPRSFEAMLARVRPSLGAGGPARRLLVIDRQRAYFVEATSVDRIETDRN